MSKNCSVNRSSLLKVCIFYSRSPQGQGAGPGGRARAKGAIFEQFSSDSLGGKPKRALGSLGRPWAALGSLKAD